MGAGNCVGRTPILQPLVLRCVHALRCAPQPALQRGQHARHWLAENIVCKGARVDQPQHAGRCVIALRHQRGAYADKHVRVMRQPCGGVVDRMQRHKASGGQRAVRGAQAPDAAIAGGNAGGAACVGSQRKVHQLCRHCRHRAAGGASRNAFARIGVDGRPVMHIVAQQAEGEFIRQHLAEKRGASGKQRVYERA